MSDQKANDGPPSKKESKNVVQQASEETFYSIESSSEQIQSAGTAPLLSGITQHFARAPTASQHTNDDRPSTSREATEKRPSDISEIPIKSVTYLPPDSIRPNELEDNDEAEDLPSDQNRKKKLVKTRSTPAISKPTEESVEALPTQSAEPQTLPENEAPGNLKPLGDDRGSGGRKKKVLTKKERELEEKKQKYNLGTSFFGLTTAPSDTSPTIRKEDLHIETAASQRSLHYGNAFIYMLIPPDGGFGWIIVVISFICQVIVDGIILAMGIVLPFIEKDLDVSAQNGMLIVSVQLGPFASAFLNKYGFRPVALIGAVVATLAVLGASFAQDLVTLLLVYSLIGGAAFSLIWVCSQLIIGFYFEKYRPIAFGLSCSGAGAGLFIFAFANDPLCQALGWRGTFRVYVGLLIAIFAMCWVYVQVAPTLIGRVQHPEVDTDTDETDVLEYFREYTDTATQSIPFEKDLENQLVEYEPEAHKQGCCRRMCGKCYRDDSTLDMKGKSYVLKRDPIERQDLYYTGPASYDEGSEESKLHKTETSKRRVQTVQNTLSQMTLHGGARPIPYRRTSTYSRFNPKRYLPQKVTNAIQVLFNFSLLKMMEFNVLLLSAFFFPLGFAIPFFFSKARAEIDDSAKLHITPMIGLSNFVFRILCGFVAYKYKPHVPMLCGGGLIIGGLIVLISAFFGKDLEWFQLLYAFIYGLAPAAYSTLRAIMYVRYLGLDKLTGAFGLTAVAMGVGVFLGVSIAAMLTKITGSYTMTFVWSGFCLIASGTLKIILPYLIVWKEKREAKRRRVNFE